MSTDVKKHTNFAAGEKPSRAALAAAILSINDVIPVANATEATQVAVAIAQSGQNLATTPVVVSRADAPALNRIEYTYDPAGLVWLPASGTLDFATVAAANAWASSNGGLLVVDDRCRINGVQYRWTGTAWAVVNARLGVRRTTAAQAISNTAYQNVSAAANWAEEFRSGLDVYADGITVPVAGEYEISYAISATQNIFTGISVNKDAVALADLSIPATGVLAQGIATATASAKITLPAGAKIRIWAIASAAGATMRTEAGLSYFQAQLI